MWTGAELFSFGIFTFDCLIGFIATEIFLKSGGFIEKRFLRWGK